MKIILGNTISAAQFSSMSSLSLWGQLTYTVFILTLEQADQI